jgi:hypothetical protein
MAHLHGGQEVHGDDELGKNESAALLGVGELPDPAEDLVGEARFVKDLPGLLSRQHVALEWLALEQGRVLSHLFGGQRRDTRETAGGLGLDRGRRRRRAGGRRGREEAIESRYRTLLEGEGRRRFASSLSMADETKNGAEAGGCQEATVLLVGNLPDL